MRIFCVRQDISRILFPPTKEAIVICLGPILLLDSSELPFTDRKSSTFSIRYLLLHPLKNLAVSPLNYLRNPPLYLRCLNPCGSRVTVRISILTDGGRYPLSCSAAKCDRDVRTFLFVSHKTQSDHFACLTQKIYQKKNQKSISNLKSKFQVKIRCFS